MANWNNKWYFNQLPQNLGFCWNGAKYVYNVNISEIIRCTDNILPLWAKLILSDNTASFYDSIAQTALYGVSDTFRVHDSMSLTVMFNILEKLNIGDKFSDLIVSAFLKDNIKLIDEARQFAELITSDILPINDIVEPSAFLKLLDECNFEEFPVYMKALINAYDTFNVSDRTQFAISDFFIGAHGELDRAYDWFLPFNMKVDWGKSSIQIMPEAEITSVEMPGMDGSIIEDTVYKDRMFQIVSYSEQGLSTNEKEELKSKITKILDMTKHQTKKLTIQKRGISFDVKYDGAADIAEGPSYVKASVPLRATPYGYDMFENEVKGKGLIKNDGDASLGVKNIISGPISNPTFTISATTFKYNGNIPDGQQLVIDHAMMTCYLQDKSGNKIKNALADLSGDFLKIPPRTSVVIDAPNETASHLLTQWSNKMLW